MAERTKLWIAGAMKKLLARKPLEKIYVTEICREAEIDIDYTGFSIQDSFVVGFGLDYAQKYRNLPYIGVVEFDD